jgi:hypothetical protein
VDLFGRKMARDGVLTVGTVERVVVTEKTTGGDDAAWGGYAGTIAYLWCKFTDQQGVERTEEIEKQFAPPNIPPPGVEIQIRYLPDNPTKFETAATSWSTPAGPRGWGAGIFEVEDLDGHHTKAMFANRTLDRQRELFRTGQRAQAEVVSVTCLDPLATNAGLRHLKRGAHEYSLALRAGGREIETHAFAPARCVPQPGDLIEIAISDDGSEVALDSDERYDGPPGQALVFTTPPELAAQRPQEGSLSDQVVGHAAAPSAPTADVIAGISETMARLKGARVQYGKHYEQMVRAQLTSQRKAGHIDDATFEQLLNEALAE